MENLNIKNEMREFDRKNRRFYDDLTEEERKKFSNYLMIRWGSAVYGSREMQEFYVIATNERLNRHFFAANRHPKLQWLMATTVSPGMGSLDHPWIAPKKNDPGNNEVKRGLMALNPSMKTDDIEILAKLTDKKILRDYLREHGNETKD